MEGLFPLDDDIDFSDEDINFSLIQPKKPTLKKDNIRPQTNTDTLLKTPTNSKNIYSKPKPNKFNFVKTPTLSKNNRCQENNSFAIGKSQTDGSLLQNFLDNNIDIPCLTTSSSTDKISAKSNDCKKQKLSEDEILKNFLDDDEKDELLSQIYIPIPDAQENLLKQKQISASTGHVNNTTGKVHQSKYLNANYNINKVDYNSQRFKEKRRNNQIQQQQPLYHSSVSSRGINNEHKPITSQEPFTSNATGAQMTVKLNNVSKLTAASHVTPVRNECKRNIGKSPIDKYQSKIRGTSNGQRKFPGPAGNLPKLNNFSVLNTLRSPEINKMKRPLTPITPTTPLQNIMNFSQSESDSYSDLWKEMKTCVRSSFSNIKIYNIECILEKATTKTLDNCKVPLLYGIIKSFSVVGCSGKLVLKDHSGEIIGAVHRNVLEEHDLVLKSGTGIILKDVSVFSPNVKKHYVNITPSNIVQFFLRDSINESQSQASQLYEDKETVLSEEDVEPDYHRKYSKHVNKQNLTLRNVDDDDNNESYNFFSDDFS